jgi:hypothetical protein
MTEELIVRQATADDVHDVMALTLECHAENGFVAADPVKMLNELYPALVGVEGIVGIIGGRGQPAEGCVVLRIGTISYSDEKVLEEKFLFVRKEYRSAKGGRARLLAEFTKKASDVIGIPLIIGILSNHRTKSKVRLYERVFGEPAGAFFLYNARTDFKLGSAESEA